MKTVDELNRRPFRSTKAVLPAAGYEALKREKSIQGAMLEIRQRYGKNAVVKGMNLLEGATTMERNNQIGGHRR